MNKKPVIGIVAKPRDLGGRFDYCLVSDDVKKVIVKSGGLPVGLLPCDLKYVSDSFKFNFYEMDFDEVKLVEELLNCVQGVVLQGGLVLNSYELQIAKLCLSADKPILGICCGFDVMLAATGHDVVFERDDFHWQIGKDIAHEIMLNEETFFYSILKSKIIKVNSIHKSVVLPIEICSDWRVGAICPDDGSVEVIEFKDHRFALGVRFHPELSYLNFADFFDRFVAACRD